MSTAKEKALVLLLICFPAAIVYGGQKNLRFVEKFRLPESKETVVVAEGDFEPRSIGSYALTVYSGRSEKFPTDDFVTGLIRPRNGGVAAVKFEDVDNDGKRDIVVVIRSAGSGGHLSADAFRYQSRQLELIGSVSNLDKNIDPVQALRAKLKVVSEIKEPR